jgi:hypothetical protein
MVTNTMRNPLFVISNQENTREDSQVSGRLDKAAMKHGPRSLRVKGVGLPET